MLHLKWLLLITCGVLLLAQNGQALNLAQNPGFETAYTGADPNFMAENWVRFATNATGVADASISTTGGVGGSKALYITTTGAVGGTSSSNGAWQIIPVVVGKKYQIHGQWKGDISIQSATGSVATVQVYVGFSSSSTTRASTDTLIYSKRNQYGTTNIYHVDPNGGGWNWQEISAAPAPGWGGDDAVTATNTYMTVRFNLQTVAQTATNHVYVDNVTVQGCQTAIGQPDVNSDCVVNMKDMALIGTNWLTCGVAPQSLCW